MRTTTLRPLIIALAFVTTFSSKAISQTYNSAVEYLNAIGETYNEMDKEKWDYTSAVARDKNAKKIEKRRVALLNSLNNAKESAAGMPEYESNSSLRDSVVSYLSMSYDIINLDYGKIVDLEEVAQQSYDLMEAYILAQQKANDRMNTAFSNLKSEIDRFATDNNINLIDSEQSKLGKRLEKAAIMYDYYNVIYLIFFKANIAESNLTIAMNNQDVAGMQQAQDAIINASSEGLEKLKGIKPFKGDNSLVEVANSTLEFYKEEAEEHLPNQILFFIKKENYDKANEYFASLPKKKKNTQEEVDKINKAGEEYNSAVATFNETNEILNKKRSKTLDNWNKTVKTFTSKHIK